MAMILNETYDFIKKNYAERIEQLTIDEVRFGVLLTAVRLSDGSHGAASTMPDIQHHCLRKNRDFSDFTPTNVVGHRVTALFETEKKSGLIDTLRIAVLNAISSTIIANGNYKIVEDADPIDLIDLNSEKTITIVGAFNSYIHRISSTKNKLYVLELNRDALVDEFKKYYVPAENYGEVIPQSDIVIITGLTLVNSTIDGLLAAIGPHTQVVVTGPSSSLIPDILFRNKVNIIGASRVYNPERLFTIVSEYGTGYHLFKYCAKKICILNE
ncbi:MAG: DUF364 domain-containing protein [Tenuifilaceae bacterium]|jgi:uncharacterized protein (DUF4213/DUF364 family)|nr:DUF364 domain-containing protein [Bacteroidales bacterium]MDI9516132.1 DUF364 domain-containing protein [Bacteroidota bacterium]NLH57770.1 DUF364 domain-containing protein [Rikenellaceae bacterium]HNV81772.1 DUF364 domain-containing protein [Tenuifilaceae bacterium]MZP83239.1 hypothetical protein [Bacteroidales bacterium]